MDKADFDTMTPTQRLAYLRGMFVGKEEPKDDYRHVGLDLGDFELLAELPVTPPEEKDEALRELRRRLHRC